MTNTDSPENCDHWGFCRCPCNSEYQKLSAENSMLKKRWERMKDFADKHGFASSWDWKYLMDIIKELEKVKP